MYRRGWTRLGFTSALIALIAAAPERGIARPDADGPRTLRVEWVEKLARQPPEHPPSVVWSDDFAEKRHYPRDEIKGEWDTTEGYGGVAGSFRCAYRRGACGAGHIHLFIGDTPVYRQRAARRNETFREVYCRFYVRHGYAWVDRRKTNWKLARVLTIATPEWACAAQAHVWSSTDAAAGGLIVDPATGIADSRLVARKYNDAERSRWLGIRGPGATDPHAPEENGRWICVETQVRLNAPGSADGVQRLWIDGDLQAEATGLDWHGAWTEKGLNAVFLEAYVNEPGAPRDQHRWFDEWIVATTPIGPIHAPSAPLIRIAVPPEAAAKLRWQVEIGTGDRDDVVFRSETVEAAREVRIDAGHGTFRKGARRSGSLTVGQTCRCRVRAKRRKGWTAWSPWHQPFVVGP